MAMSWDQAVAEATGPGSLLELVEAEVLGNKVQVYKNAPQHLGQIFAAARNFGDHTFLVYEDEIWSFAKVMEHVDALAHLLVTEYGIVKGDRVAIGMRNYPEWVISFAAIVSVGAISVSMNSWWTDDEIDFALKDSGSKVFIVDHQRHKIGHQVCGKLGIREIVVRADGPLSVGVASWDKVLPLGAAHPNPSIDPDDDATILYTSGTTGRPKGAVSTHRAIISSLLTFGARGAVDLLREGKVPDPNEPPLSFILIVPLFHVTGCVPVMLSCFTMGLKLVIMYKWDPEKALQIIEKEKISNFVGVPTQSWDLINHPRFKDFDTSSLRVVGGGGAPAPAALVAKVAQSVPTGGPQLGYGLTETNAFGPGNRGQDYLTHPTSAGRTQLPMHLQVRDQDLTEVPVGEHGEIWFSGPMLIRGYWNNPTATAETIVDGWLRSGDIGHVDEEGFVYVDDRLKDMVLRAGENVYSAEVEDAIYQLPAVHEAAVFGLPHERMGEEVAVAILPNPGTTLRADELWSALEGKLAAFKIPSKVVIMTEPLPRNASGKIMKRELQKLVVEGKLIATGRL